MIENIRASMKMAEMATNRRYDVPSSFAKVSNVLFLGMGGSGVAGEIARDITEPFAPLPVTVRNRPDIPAFAGERTLVFAISYSGNTFETLSALSSALERGCKVIGLTSGGAMSEMLAKRQCVRIDLPTGYQPREAVTSMLFPVLSIFGSLGWYGEQVDLPWLSSTRDEVESLAKKLAPRLAHRTPVIYSEWRSVGHRMKSQLNENAKTPARYDLITELFHNEVNAWDHLGESHVLLLRDGEEREDLNAMVESSKSLLRGAEVTEIVAKGPNRSTRILYLIWLGDFISYYLAVEKGVDPVRVPAIDYLKSAMAKREPRAGGSAETGRVLASSAASSSSASLHPT